MTEHEQDRQPLQARWLVVTAIVVIALIFLIPFIREGGARVDTSVEVETKTARIGKIRETVLGESSILDAKKTPLNADFAGRIQTLSVEEGQLVEAGDVIALYDENSLNDQLLDLLDQVEALDEEIAEAAGSGTLEITSPASGTLKAVYAQRGDIVSDVLSRHNSLMVLSSNDLLRVELPLPQDWSDEETEVEVLWNQRVLSGTASITENGKLAVTFEDQSELTLGTQVTIQTKDEVTLGTAPVACDAPQLITCEEGILAKLHVAVGDRVEKGQLLAECLTEAYNDIYLSLMDRRVDLVDQTFRLQEFILNPVLTASEDGRIAQLALEEGDDVEAGMLICNLTSGSSFTIQADIPQEKLSKIQPGQTVELQFDAHPSTTYLAQVASVPEADSDSREAEILIDLVSAPGLEPGMQGEAVIITAQENEALLVPSQALKLQENGTPAIEVYYGDGLTRTYPVEIGLRTEELVQVLNGVHEGEEVVVSSRVVETKVFTLFNHEWVIDP